MVSSTANALDIGEALGHAGWWYNATHFEETLDVVDHMISFILNSANPRQFTLGAGNEAGDTGLRFFGTPNTISNPDGVNYYNSFQKTVYAMLQKRASFVPLMIQDSFMGASYWAPFWNKGDNIVFDSHFYFCESYMKARRHDVLPIPTLFHAIQSPLLACMATSFPRSLVAKLPVRRRISLFSLVNGRLKLSTIILSTDGLRFIKASNTPTPNICREVPSGVTRASSVSLADESILTVLRY